MKVKYILFVVSVTLAVHAAAQETYQMANIETPNVIGTARFVSMGGAMNALGADISTIGTNPAAIGVFRRNEVTGTLGLSTQQGGSYASADKTHASFDQMGVVYSVKTNNRGSRLNFALNYHKSRDFNQILTALGSLGGDASQNKLTATKFNCGIISSYTPLSTSDDAYDTGELTASALDVLYATNLLSSDDNGVDWFDADSYQFGRNSKGYISSYDFNISGSIHDRIFLGTTIGLQDVHYKSASNYFEAINYSSTDENPLTSLNVYNNDRITGTGANIAFGVIFLPIDQSPFRIGAYVKTPTFYDLTASSNVQLTYNGASMEAIGSDLGKASVDYSFKFNTPWKFGVALASTAANKVAFDVEYEFSDYSATDARIDDGTGYYDYWTDYYYSSTESDAAMNANVEKCLKGVHTVRLGLEYRPAPSLALRLGYNYVSPLYKKDGYRDPSIYSLGNYYSTSTDYTIWRSTNNISAGLGYSVKRFFVDLGYQYSTTSGEFYPFVSSSGLSVISALGTGTMPDNLCSTSHVKNIHNRLILTLGYKF